MTKYYLSNGQSNVDFGWVLKGAGQPVTEGYTLVLDELCNGGWKAFEVENHGLVEITEADYQAMYDLNLLFSDENVEEQEIYQAIDKLIAKYINPFDSNNQIKDDKEDKEMSNNNCENLGGVIMENITAYIGKSFKDWNTGEIVSLKEVNAERVIYCKYEKGYINDSQSLDMPTSEFLKVYTLL